MGWGEFHGTSSPFYLVQNKSSTRWILQYLRTAVHSASIGYFKGLGYDYRLDHVKQNKLIPRRMSTPFFRFRP